MAERKHLLQKLTNTSEWKELVNLAMELQHQYRKKPTVGENEFETLKNAIEKDAKVSAIQTLIDEAERIGNE